MTAILLAGSSTYKPGFTDGGVQYTWDLQNYRLRGTFDIHIIETTNPLAGTYTITAADFLQPPANYIPPASPARAPVQ